MGFVRRSKTAEDDIGAENKPEFSEIVKDVYTPPTTGDVFKAAFSAENSLGSLIANRTSLSDKPQPVEGYDPLAENKEDIKGYEYFSQEFMFSQSPEETASIKAGIDRELKDRETLRNSGAMGFVAQMSAGITDPIYLPLMLTGVGVWGRSGSVLAQVGKTGIISGASEVVAEAAKHSTQTTRTLNESLANITGATLFAGVLKGVGHGLGKLKVNKMVDNIDADIVEQKVAINGAVPDIDADYLIPDAAGNFDLVGAGKIEKLGFSPLARTQTSKSESVKSIVSTMMETPLVSKGNVEGISTAPVGGAVETRIKLYDAPLSESLTDLDTLYSKYRQGKGVFGQMVDKITRRSSEKMTFGEFSEAAGKASRRGDKSNIPEVEAAAKSFRKKVIDPPKNSAMKLGMLADDLDVKTAESYLTRIYKVKKIKAERLEWDTIVGNWLKQNRATAKNIAEDLRTPEQIKDAAMTDLRITQAVNKITDNITGAPDGMATHQSIGTAGALKERVFLIPDELIEDFLESDISMIARQYTRSMAPDIELTRAFGDSNLKAQFDAVKADYALKMKSAKTNKEIQKLKNREARDINDISAMRDRLMGTYKAPANPDDFFIRAGRTLRDVNFVRMLGSMTLSAIPDMARPIAVNGLRPVAKGLVSLATSPKRYNIARKEAKKFAVGLDMVLNSRASSLAEVADGYVRGSAFERGLRATSDVFSKMTLMSQWNSSLKQFSGVVTSDRLLSESVNLSKGTIKKNALRRMAQAGIGKDMAVRIAKQFEKFGDDGTIKLSNAHMWDDVDAYETFKAAVLKDVDRTIVTPGKGEAPLWTSSEGGKLIFQFKTFAGAAHHKVLLSGLQHRDAAELTGFLISVGLGTLTYGLKNWVAGREVSDDPSKVIIESLDRSGAFGYMWDANNIMEKLSRGTFGINPAMGGAPMSRYASRNLTGALLGPSFGTVQDIFQVTGAAASGEFTKKDLRKVRGLLPFQNLFYMRQLLNKIEDKAGRGLKK